MATSDLSQTAPQSTDHNLNKRDLEILQNLKAHVDQRISESLDFFPEMLAKQNLRVVPVRSLKETAKQLGAVAGVAFVAGIAGGFASNLFLKRREKKAAASIEVEKEYVTQNGTRRTMPSASSTARVS